MNAFDTMFDDIHTGFLAEESDAVMAEGLFDFLNGNKRKLAKDMADGHLIDADQTLGSVLDDLRTVFNWAVETFGDRSPAFKSMEVGSTIRLEPAGNARGMGVDTVHLINEINEIYGELAGMMKNAMLASPRETVAAFCARHKKFKSKIDKFNDMVRHILAKLGIGKK